MKQFAYKARDTIGRSHQGVVQAESLQATDQFFMKSGLIPIEVHEKKDVNFKLSFKRDRISQAELITFTKQMAVAYSAGINVSNVLEILSQQTYSPKFANVIKTITGKVREGSTLTQAFSEHPKVFDSTYLAVIRAGEATGDLGVVLDHATHLMEQKEIHRERINSALLYPKLVLGMIFLTSAIVVVFVVPQFATLYGKFNTELPLPTKILMGASTFVSKWWWAMGLFVGGLVFGYRKSKNWDKFMMWWDTKVLKVPVFGQIILKSELSHFCSMISHLMRAGVLVTDAVEIATDGIKNRLLRLKLKGILTVVAQGGTITAALEAISLIPPMMVSVAKVGEESGKLDKLLDQMAKVYDNDIETILKKLPTLMEPVLLSVLFGMVLLLALAIYLPLWKMASFAKPS